MSSLTQPAPRDPSESCWVRISPDLVREAAGSITGTVEFLQAHSPDDPIIASLQSLVVRLLTVVEQH